ncbi:MULTISPECIES: DUF6489 family protein [unclassified Bradyrhizobium]|uniref:DUF6489 family protein n=1 Tax=unclassified Bradyrhizobium TaxID=2631580 RepID=UPI000685B93A|nr:MULTISPECIES: DUF6489 family protein [unclassified Bradyrhizobium]QIG98276.1 hypothetical protein G6P99_42905 [Bradyrhizobium sp. 6(2017)]
MDVTININLTPAEVRQLMGLPDVQPLQEAALAKMQDGIMARAETFSTDGLLDAWFGTKANPAMDAFRDVVGGALSQGLARGMAASKRKETGRE